MREPERGSARDEAERLVATVLAMASQAGRDTRGSAAATARLADALRLAVDGAASAARAQKFFSGTPWRPPTEPASDDNAWSRATEADAAAATDRAQPEPSTATQAGGFATGSAECCVCPVCRAIAMMRDPSPEFAERLATSAADLAAGVAGLMRAFAAAGGSTDGAHGGRSAAGRTPAADPPAARPPEPAFPAPDTKPTGNARNVTDAGTYRYSDRSHSSEPAGGEGLAAEGGGARDPWAAATHAAVRESAEPGSRSGERPPGSGDPGSRSGERAPGSGDPGLRSGDPGLRSADGTGDHDREPGNG